jgi:protein-disulfide isomerase
MQDGDRAGVDGTPSLFINGKRYRGSLELEPMRAIIEAELKAVKK